MRNRSDTQGNGGSGALHAAILSMLSLIPTGLAAQESHNDQVGIVVPAFHSDNRLRD